MSLFSVHLRARGGHGGAGDAVAEPAHERDVAGQVGRARQQRGRQRRPGVHRRQEVRLRHEDDQRGRHSQAPALTRKGAASMTFTIPQEPPARQATASTDSLAGPTTGFALMVMQEIMQALSTGSLAKMWAVHRMRT